MKKTIIISDSITVSYFVNSFIASVDEARSLICILSCLDYATKEYSDLYHFIYNEITRRLNADIDWSDWYHNAYLFLNYVEDEKYYDAHIDKFREYQKHMNEPDFDWDFYSDWYKDLFGFRPR